MAQNDSHNCNNCANQGHSLFKNLNENETQQICAHKTCNTYKKGQVIFHEGNKPLGLFCLKSGKVKIYKTGIEGREQIVRLAKPGDLIGYRSFLGDDIYTASAAALDDAVLCFIDKGDFLQDPQNERKYAWPNHQALNR